MEWTIKKQPNNIKELSLNTGLTEAMVSILASRGIDNEEKIIKYVKAGLSNFHSPSLLKNLDDSVEMTIKFIKEQKKIRILGDYDVDGITSTCIAVKGLKECGATVDYAIPNRVNDGYGLNERLVKEAKKDNIDLIITVDNGISAFESIELAKQYGISVIVTDHHEIQYKSQDLKEYELPNAAFCINPHLPDSEYPYKGICGAMTILKFITRLYSKMDKTPSMMNELIELAALGTVCDVMDLKDENRAIVKAGLKLMQNSSNAGIRGLIKAYELENKKISSYHLGFILGPALNSSGRLCTAEISEDLLLETNDEKAYEKALKLKEINEERKSLTEQGSEAAELYLKDNGLLNDDVYVIYLENTHESIAGIVAGRIKEKYNHPTIVFTNTENIEVTKGSGRSIPGYNMFNKLSECKDLFVSFGGHEMAAGLSVKKTEVETLRQRLNKNTGLTLKDFEKKVKIDVYLPFHMVTEKFVNELELLEPCGKGNEKPIIAEKNVLIERANLVGKNKNVLKLTLVSERGKRINGVYFGNIESFDKFILEKYGQEEYNKMYQGQHNQCKVAMTYVPSINEWNNIRNIEVIVKDIK